MNQRTHTPTVSMIVPVYNGECWLRRCLDSIAAQTFTDFECFLVDDGSTDGSGNLCESYIKQDQRFKVIHKKNGGISSARNAALAQMSGQYLMFCDQDDAIHPKSMEYAVQLQQSNPEAMILWTYTRDENEYYRRMDEPLRYIVSDRSKMAWRADRFTTVWNRIFDAELVRCTKLRFDETLGWTDSLGEDTDFNEKYIHMRYKDENFVILFSDQPRYFYFNENSASVTQNAVSPAKRTVLPSPEPAYCARLLAECKKVRQTLDPQKDAQETALYARHYLRCLAFGVWSAHALREPLPKNLFGQPEVKDLLTLCKTHRIYSPYYLLFRLHFGWGLRRLYAWDETYHPNFFRAGEAMYRLFFRGWNR